MKKIVALVLPLTFAACLYAGEPVESISMISVISKPEAYDNRKIRLSGNLVIKLEEHRLYLDEYHSFWGIDENSIWLEIPGNKLEEWKKLNNSTVLIEGTLIFQDDLHNSYKLQLQQITRVDTLLNRDEISEMINKSKAEYNKGKDPEDRIK